MLEGWSKLDPTPAWLKDEIELFVATKIALYVGEEKKPRLEDQTITITSHRIINKDESMSIDLSDMVDHDTKSGFLSSSAKILLWVKIKEMEDKSEVQSSASKANWNCPACEEANEGTVERCDICGTINPNLAKVPVQEQAGSSRRVLTKLSFRGSGHGKFLEQLGSALQRKSWKESAKRALAELESRSFAPKVAGVSGLMKKAEEDRAKQSVSQTEAFGDLDALMKQASEMGRLAEMITSKLNSKMATDKLDEAEDKEFKSLMADLGFTSQAALTSKTSSRYHIELAKQLSTFVIKLFELKRIQMATLADVYCFYNRSRGTDLVSPQDLARAAAELESFGFPIYLRSLSSGLLVVQSVAFSDEQVTKRILERLRPNAFITPSELASRESISVQLAAELLTSAELLGRLCRDLSPSGPQYYPNLILNIHYS